MLIFWFPTAYDSVIVSELEPVDGILRTWGQSQVDGIFKI